MHELSDLPYERVVQGIPIMSPDEYRKLRLEQPLLEKWKKHLKGSVVETSG